MAALTYTGNYKIGGQVTTKQYFVKVGQPGGVQYPALTYIGKTGRVGATVLGATTYTSYTSFLFTNQGRQYAPVTYNQSFEVRGFVQSSAGVGISRTVIALSQTMPQTVLGTAVSSPSTGAFAVKLYTAADPKVTVVAIPDVGDGRNIVAYRDIVPVVIV